MEAKFRVSPMIDSVLSQRLEGRTRGKVQKGRENPIQKHLEKAKIVEIDEESDEDNPVSEKDKGKEKALPIDEGVAIPKPRSRLLPYVDVPSIRPTLRPMTVTAVEPDQPAQVTPPPKRDKASITEAAGASYKNRAPVEAGLDFEKLVESVLDLEIKVPLRSLAGASGAIQREIKKQMTKTRQLSEEANKVNCLSEIKQFTKVEELPIACFTIMNEVSEDIPEGYLVADDPIVQYLNKNQEGDPLDLIVARPSEPLRAIYAHVNGVGQEECLLDPGSMIVSMAKETAVSKGLTWDPSIRINMESASSHLERTLGIARNVCFRTGGLDLYMQVHILENPPYRVLLGRPFDVFTSSVVRTSSDGSSEIVLTDPNTKRIAVVPTYERGKGPEDIQKQTYQDFGKALRNLQEMEEKSA